MQIEVCELHDDDMVFVTVPEKTSERNCKTLKAMIQEHVGENVKVVVLPDVMSVRVVRKSR